MVEDVGNSKIPRTEKLTGGEVPRTSKDRRAKEEHSLADNDTPEDEQVLDRQITSRGPSLTDVGLKRVNSQGHQSQITELWSFGPGVQNGSTITSRRRDGQTSDFKERSLCLVETLTQVLM